MTKSELAKEIIEKLPAFLLANGIVDQAKFNSINDELSMGRITEAATLIANETPFKRIFEYLRTQLGCNDPISNTLNLRKVNVEQKNESKLADFCYKNADLRILPCAYLNRYISTLSIVDNKIMAIIEDILYKIKDDAGQLEEFWNVCLGQHNKCYYIMTMHPADKDWSLYSYAYLCFVNEDGFSRSPKLSFNKDQKLSANIIFDAANKYEQYFDAYGVMCESKYADDVLARYLKMYQMIEYFAFRKVLADMTKGNIRENGFVRNVLAELKNGSKDEFKEISKGLKAMFQGANSLENIIPKTDYTPQQIDFLQNKLRINMSNYDENRVCNIIYQLRNCIVHNKESELHFAYYNVDKYEDGIDILKNFINKLEPALIGVINDSSNTVLEYDKPEIPLF